MANTGCGEGNVLVAIQERAADCHEQRQRRYREFARRYWLQARAIVLMGAALGLAPKWTSAQQQILATPYRGTYLLLPQGAVGPVVIQPNIYAPAYPYPYIYPYQASYLLPRVERERPLDLGKVTPAGRLTIKVQPQDAEVFVDGFPLEKTVGNGYEIGLLVGPHRIEAHSPLYQHYSEAVEIRRNEGLLVTIRLQKEKQLERGGNHDSR